MPICETVKRFQDEKGRELARIWTPGIESTEGLSEFTVTASLVTVA